MRRALALAVLGGVLAACRAPKPSNLEASGAAPSSRYAPAEDVPGCRLYGEPQAVGRVPLVLAEMSGLAASVRHPGVLWAHNDSGNAFQVFAIDETGKPLATLTLTGVDPEDMDLEDIALGPCAPGDARTCVYRPTRGTTSSAASRCASCASPSRSRWPMPPWPWRSCPSPGRTGRTTARRSSSSRARAGRCSSPRRATRWARSSRCRGSLRARWPGPRTWGRCARRATWTGAPPPRRSTPRGSACCCAPTPGCGRCAARGLAHGGAHPGPGRRGARREPAQSEAITWLPGDAGADRSYLIGSEFAGQRLYRVDCR
ncbi:hypothetical protein ACN28S_14750 [Cystobacter fuscus]